MRPPWKQRFRAPVVLWTTVARNAPSAGLAVSNRSGAYQLYAWDVPTGDLTQLTDRPLPLYAGWRMKRYGNASGRTRVAPSAVPEIRPMARIVRDIPPSAAPPAARAGVRPGRPRAASAAGAPPP